MSLKKEKLLKRNIEPETRILMEDLVDFDGCVALMELWSYEGITASSIVFLEEDLEAKSDKEVVKYVFEKLKQPVDEQTTITRSDGYVYVNYGFVVD